MFNLIIYNTQISEHLPRLMNGSDGRRITINGALNGQSFFIENELDERTFNEMNSNNNLDRYLKNALLSSLMESIIYENGQLIIDKKLITNLRKEEMEGMNGG
ncbi:unnamed protein product [marine sediment metagenome]|uniref:Uncharacterized protein n=1 Tax=marine sediment metagenome TaxID=412755 RepID=X0W397_9ZZZZ